MMNRYLKFHIIVFVFSSLPAAGMFSSGFSQGSEKSHQKFAHRIVDPTGTKIDSLPVVDDSVYVQSGEFEFYRVNGKGEVKGGISVFSDLDLNLSLQIGEEEDLEMSGIKRGFFWLSNFTVRLVSLTFWNPQWGANGLFFDQTAFKTDLRRILKLYADQGYFETRIDKYEAVFSKNQKEVRIKVYLEEGKPTKYVSKPVVSILSSKPVIDPKNALNPLKLASDIPTQKDDVLIAENIEVAKSVLQKAFSQNGYPSAIVTESIDTVSHGRNKASIIYQINPGKYSVFGDTKVKGNYYQTRFLKNNLPDTTKRIVDDYVVQRKIRYKKGRTYNPDQLGLSIGEINGLGVFRSVKPLISKSKGIIDSSAAFDQVSMESLYDSLKTHTENRITWKVDNFQRFGIPVDTMNVMIEVSDRKERSLKPGIGFTTDFRDLPQSEKDKGLYMLPFLSLQTTWQSRNFYGGARKMQISGKISKGFQDNKFFANYMEAKITFRQPSFRLPFTNDVNNDLVITLAGTRNNTFTYDLVKYDASPTFIRQLTREINLSFTPFAFTKQNIRAVYGTIDTTSIRNFYTTNTRIGATFNNTNDMFYPSEGFLVYLLTDFSGFLLPSDLKYIKVSLDNRKYIRISKAISVALRFRAASAKPYKINDNPSEIPISEKFYCGGPNSVRGWAIKELGILTEKNGTITYAGGNSILETGLEVRYNLFMSKNPTDAVTGTDLAFFADAGNVWTEYNFRNLPEDLPAKPVIAVGTGVRIRTMIGPVRVDFGYKLVDLYALKVINDGTVQTISKSAAKKLSPYSIQITLGQAF